MTFRASTLLSTNGTEFFCENVNNLILTMPDCFNRYRDINRIYDIHEAYTILHKANIIKESYELFEEIITSSNVFTKKGERNQRKIAKEQLLPNSTFTKRQQGRQEARTSRPIDQRGVWHYQARVIPQKQPAPHCTWRCIIMKICLN